MSDEPPRRRMGDRERRRWPDERLDQHLEQTEDIEAQIQALRLLPERVKGLRDVVEALRDSIDGERQRTTDLRADVRTLQNLLGDTRREFRERFDTIDVMHNRTESRAQGVDPDTEKPLPEPFRPTWQFWLKLAGACAVGGGVPIASALIAAGAS